MRVACAAAGGAFKLGFLGVWVLFADTVPKIHSVKVCNEVPHIRSFAIVSNTSLVRACPRIKMDKTNFN